MNEKSRCQLRQVTFFFLEINLAFPYLTALNDVNYESNEMVLFIGRNDILSMCDFLCVFADINTRNLQNIH